MRKEMKGRKDSVCVLVVGIAVLEYTSVVVGRHVLEKVISF